MTKDFPTAPGSTPEGPKPFAPQTTVEQTPFLQSWPFWIPPAATADRNAGMFQATFDMQQSFYPTTTPNRWGMQDFPDMKWTDPSMYPLPFPQQEAYPIPVDPCPSVPSTSVAQSPLDYKMNSTMTAAAYPPNPLLSYYAQPDYHMAISGWKTASKAPSSKMGIPTVPHRTGAGTNNVRVRTNEKYRAVYTEQQRNELELEYQSQQFINAERKSDLADKLNLTERQVKIWFQNRRAKDRRHKKN